MAGLIVEAKECKINYELRPASVDDYQYCYRLTKRNMHALFCRHWGGWVPSEFKKGFVAKNITMIVIAGRRAGYLSVKTSSEFIYIDNMQLSPRLQRRGLGTKILTHQLTKHSGKRILLTTFDDNPAKKLYERLGFTVTEREGQTVKMEKPAR